jgi:hypothetical protein
MKKSGVNLTSVCFFMMAHCEEGERIRELLKKNKTSVERLQNPIKEFGTKIDQLCKWGTSIQENSKMYK